MNKRWIGGLGGFMLAAAGCSGSNVSQPPSIQPEQAAAESIAVSSQALPQPASATANQLPGVTVAAAPPQPLPVPDLIPPTEANQRAAQVVAGRSDPFTAVANTPVAAPVRSSQPAAVARPAAPALAQLPVTIATVPAQLPSLAPAPADVTALPAVPVAPAPIAAAPTQLASSIAVSGVVQAGDRTSAIVQLPQEGSRSVSVGDYLANGRILVKRIEIGNANTEPVVILEQDGVEVIRAVGSGSAGVGVL